jgi:CDP-diglyceride synthetase
MSLIEIIIVGLLANVAAVFFIVFITSIYYVFKNKFDAEFMKEFLYLNKLTDEHRETVNKCRSLNVSGYTQHTFIILLPFSYILVIFEVLTHLFNDTLTRYYINEIEKIINILNTRIEKAKNERV